MREKIFDFFDTFSSWVRSAIYNFFVDSGEFFKELSLFLLKNARLHFLKFESKKGTFVTALYRKRGKQARRLVHSGMAALAALGMVIAPVIADEFPGRALDPWEIPTTATVLSATGESGISTLVSDKPRDQIIEYEVQNGDTLSSIAQKFGVDTDTILWQNDLTERSTIKPGQTLDILPISGIAHKVSKGDTIYSIAKKYDVDAQPIVNYPFNTFSNDETFELAIGQMLIVPEGVKPATRGTVTTPRREQRTIDAGAVAASGQFVWPTSGRITQNFAWYHKAIDVANKSAPNVIAADGGTVVVAGWPDSYGYGNRVVIDHGNGYRTLYAHLSQIYVNVGQGVNQGDAIGRMGTTGRSTGIHLHFEVIRSGGYLNPLSVLQ